MRTLRALTYTLLILATLAMVFLAGFGSHWLLTRGGSDPVAALLTDDQPTAQENTDFSVFWEAWHILQRDFYGEKPDTQQRTYGAIKGLIQAYEDPYTYFVEPQPRQREREDLSGEFGGIGAWVSRAEDGTIRLKPMPNRAAELAGVQENDIVQAVDDTPVTPDTSVEEVVALVRGPAGTPVRLTLLRESSGEVFAVEVIRERIETPSVEWRMLDEAPQTGLIAITSFTERTTDELDRALRELEAQGSERLVIDLRHNPGGLLQTAVDVASRFLEGGAVLYERKSDGSEKTFRVTGGPKAPNWPMVILVDSATASASEIVAGALQDRGRATLVGEKTFGKGSVQLVHDLTDGSSIHVTVARWLTPNGHEIHGEGLIPDVTVPAEEGRDAPLEAAIGLLLETPIATPQ